MFKFLFFTILFTYFSTCSCDQLETVNDDELLNLIKTESHLVVLFTKKDCAECDNYELQLVQLREEIVDAVGALVVKVVQSQLLRLYSSSHEPAIVYFRVGVPLLYDGPLDEDSIFHIIMTYKEPIVKELSDETFEHLTQAATGATTGDWFVMFYSNDCVECLRLQACWEGVAAQSNTRLNVARVNKGTTGAVTARRFDVRKLPTFILFRLGKLYRYQYDVYTIASFLSFARDWHKNLKGEKIPLPKAPFDDFTTMIADYLKDNTWLFYVGITTCLIGLFASIWFNRKGAKQVKQKEKKAKTVKKTK